MVQNQIRMFFHEPKKWPVSNNCPPLDLCVLFCFASESQKTYDVDALADAFLLIPCFPVIEGFVWCCDAVCCGRCDWDIWDEDCSESASVASTKFASNVLSLSMQNVTGLQTYTHISHACTHTHQQFTHMHTHTHRHTHALKKVNIDKYYSEEATTVSKLTVVAHS